jgi:hypothetical protein
MLHQFLLEMSDGRSRNLAEVARVMDISPLMASRIAEELTRLGYLQKLEIDCGTQDRSCTGCAASPGCTHPNQTWCLTDKGMVMIEENSHII